ncbi:acyltransferase [Candidatus Accumulibacter phosphatis]|uniref:Acyltransferase n=1 Tax=Candidatus Accumulibacter contiguus TaxID=2954381 RepID=A0ABX1T325_9PROT|nr:acyltransferase [Candidatus Accumulibacter contiguus]NMQ04043.1 acyltransferase [Candidatus Accumulibacter contiguus]
MHQTTSLFLDTLRFTAAMTVLLHHLTGQTFNSSFSPVPWGREAVIAFFVISGFVIAYVLDSRERDLKIYVSARLGRLYSVILPALFITPLLDHFGRQAAPDLYREIVADHVVLRILINLANLQESWNLTTAPLSNGPFWSLAFEFWYYVVFGAYTLLSGYSRQIVILLACLAAGPRIIFTMPVWLLGVVAYRLDQKTHLHRSSACVLFAISGLGIALYMTTFGHSVLQSLNDAIFGGSHSRYWTLGGHTLFLGDLPKLPADILLGILFATAIVTVKPAMEGLHPPGLDFVVHSISRGFHVQPLSISCSALVLHCREHAFTETQCIFRDSIGCVSFLDLFCTLVSHGATGRAISCLFFLILFPRLPAPTRVSALG